MDFTEMVLIFEGDESPASTRSSDDNSDCPLSEAKMDAPCADGRCDAESPDLSTLIVRWWPCRGGSPVTRNRRS